MKLSKTDKPTTSQTSKSPTKSQPISISQVLATAIQKDTKRYRYISLTTTIPTNTISQQYTDYIP